MGLLGVDVGPRPAAQRHSPPEQIIDLRLELEELGAFDWIRA